jgi:hypothetical protein
VGAYIIQKSAAIVNWFAQGAGVSVRFRGDAGERADF